MSDLDTEQINSSDLPLYTRPQLPVNGRVILMTEEPNYSEGGTIQLAYQLPIERLIPNNNVQKISYTLVAPDAGISVPAGTVVPAYVETFDPFALKRAVASSETAKAQFLIVGTNPNVDDGYVIQGSGYYSFAEPHSYLVGQKYYLSETVDGGVVTVPPTGVAQPLFIPVDINTIQIVIEV